MGVLGGQAAGNGAWGVAQVLGNGQDSGAGVGVDVRAVVEGA